MADQNYRSFLGRVFAGPYENTATVQGGTKTLVVYKLSGPGLNGDVEIDATFWSGDPGLSSGDLLYISGKYSTYEGKNRAGEAETKKKISVNYAYKVTGETLKVADRGPQPAPKKRPSPGVVTEPDF